MCSACVYFFLFIGKIFTEDYGCIPLQHTDTDAVSTDTAYLFQGMLYPLPRYVLFSLYSVRLRKPCPLFCFTQAHDIIIVEFITGCLVMQTVGVQLL